MFQRVVGSSQATLETKVEREQRRAFIQPNADRSPHDVIRLHSLGLMMTPRVVIFLKLHERVE